MAPLRQTAFRLNESDLVLLDEAQRRLGLTSRTEALRFMLRQWANQAGVEVPRAPKPKRAEPRPKPKPKK